jgi:hypothetical protein
MFVKVTAARSHHYSQLVESFRDANGRTRQRNIMTPFALSNLWMVREKLRILDGKVCPARPIGA